MLYHILDFIFEITHGLFVLLILTGWVSPRLRKFHLAAIGLIIFSWFALGYFHYWGYCVCTDIHWQIKEKLGYQNLPPSYLAYVAERYMGLSLSNSFINWASAILFGVCMTLTAYVNFIAPKISARLPWRSVASTRAKMER